MGFLTKLDRALSIGASAFKSEISGVPFYAQLNDGTHTYNYETTREGIFGALGIGDAYYRPKSNLKWYYENTPFFSDCINIYADLASQVRIQEVDSKGEIVENSDFIKLLDQPNEWQDQIAFIKEMVINVLTSGINVQYGSFFKNGNLRVNPQLYNIDFYNLKFPKIKNPYRMKRSDIQDLKFIETLEDNEKRFLYNYELAFVYDTISRNGYGENGYSADKFLNPISRIFAIQKSLHIMLNSEDTMAFLTGNNVNWIASKNNNNGQLAALGNNEKSDIESKLSGNHRKYGSRLGKSDVIATNEDLSLLNLTRDNRKMQIIEMQNNAKENIRSKYGIPRELIDAYNGSSKGSTYENQQYAEARFTLNNVKNITDSWLYSLEKQNPIHFKNKGHKLIGTYDHMPSVIAVQTKMRNEGFKAKGDALNVVLDAFVKSKELGINFDYESFLTDNGFEDFLTTQSTE